MLCDELRAAEGDRAERCPRALRGPLVNTRPNPARQPDTDVRHDARPPPPQAAQASASIAATSSPAATIASAIVVAAVRPPAATPSPGAESLATWPGILLRSRSRKRPAPVSLNQPPITPPIRPARPN